MLYQSQLFGKQIAIVREWRMLSKDSASSDIKKVFQECLVKEPFKNANLIAEHLYTHFKQLEKFQPQANQENQDILPDFKRKQSVINDAYEARKILEGDTLALIQTVGSSDQDLQKICNDLINGISPDAANDEDRQKALQEK